MKYKFEISCCKDRLQSVRNFVHATLKNYDISEVELNQLILAVDEVCSNLIIHSHHCNEQESLELIIKVQDDSGVTFEICDRGKGFNFRKYQEPSLSDIIKSKRKGGVGLLLVRRIMDRIDCDFNDETHRNIYRMHKSMNIRSLPPADQ